MLRFFGLQDLASKVWGNCLWGRPDCPQVAMSPLHFSGGGNLQFRRFPVIVNHHLDSSGHRSGHRPQVSGFSGFRMSSPWGAWQLPDSRVTKKARDTLVFFIPGHTISTLEFVSKERWWMNDLSNDLEVYVLDPCTMFAAMSGLGKCPNLSHHRTKKGIEPPTETCFGDVPTMCSFRRSTRGSLIYLASIQKAQGCSCSIQGGARTL
jgi:hypothetical protein